MLAIFSLPAVTDGLPWWLSRYRIYLQCRRHRRGGFNLWVRKIPSKRKWQPTPEFLPEKPLDRGAWWAAVQRVWKSWTQLSMPSLTVTSFFHVLSKEKFFSLLHLSLEGFFQPLKISSCDWIGSLFSLMVLRRRICSFFFFIVVVKSHSLVSFCIWSKREANQEHFMSENRDLARPSNMPYIIDLLNIMTKTRTQIFLK